MTTLPTHAAAGRFDHTHGDESQGVYAAFEEAWIDHRTDELLAERLNDCDRFHDLLDGIDRAEIEPHLFRALMNLDRAINGEAVGRDAVYSALTLIQDRLRIEAQSVWADECREEAEQQLKREVA